MAGRAGSWEEGALLAGWNAVAGAGSRWGSGPAAGERPCPFLDVPSENLLVVGGVAGGAGGVDGFRALLVEDVGHTFAAVETC